MKKVLFVCTHNAGRSQMAEAFFNAIAPADVRAESAGQAPIAAVWPAVVQAMGEVGVDLSQRWPKRLLPEMQLHADRAVTFACDVTCPFVPTVVEDWDVPDPAGRSLADVRVIREQIDGRVRDLLSQRLEAIRTDRTAHQFRLARLLPALAERFPDRPEGEIRSCADAVLAEFADAPVRSFAITLAERRARQCLASGRCVDGVA